MEPLWQPGVTLEELEKAAILKALRFHGGNKTVTANALGIAIRTLDSKLEKYANDKSVTRPVGRNYDITDGGRRDQWGRIKPEHDIRSPKYQGDPAAQKGAQAKAGLLVEPASQVPAQQPVPVSDSADKEVQELLSKKPTPSNSKSSNRGA